MRDLDYRATRVTSDLPNAGGQPYFDKQFTWDHASRVTAIADLANSALDAVYGYDALDRLTSATQGAATWGYTYNGIGDRLTSTTGGVTTSYGYFTGTHRLQALSGAQSRSYTFDAAGNTTGDGTVTWVYGGNNRPTQAGSTTFLINTLGQRVKKTTGANSVRFVYDEAGRLWGEYDGTGALIQETVWLDELPIATLRSNGSGTDIYYVHPDHLGTPRSITRSSDNQVVWKWDNTEPFGNALPNENPSGLGSFVFNLRFPGQYYDVETGTHYNYHRDFDASLGRYLQSDPIGLRAGLNTYAYVDSNPLIFDDPLGLQRGRGGPPIPGDLGRQPYVPDYWRKDYYRDYRDGYLTRPCIEYSCPTPQPQSCSPSNPTGGPMGPTSGPFLSGPDWSPGKSGCVCVAYGWQWHRGLDKVPGFSYRAGI